jgi:hypothetical protein
LIRTTDPSPNHTIPAVLVSMLANATREPII